MKFSRLSLFALGAVCTVGMLAPAFADETATEKAATAKDEAVKDAKQEGRKAKKKLRDATGNSSIKKDAQDAAQNVGDELEAGARKAKRKAD